MELQYFGADSLRLSTKKSIIAIDPQSDIVKLPLDIKKVDTVVSTQSVFIPKDISEVFLIDSPGEYEFEDYSIKGVAAQAHNASTGDKSATVYRIVSGDITLLVVGHIHEKLTEEQLESIGTVDVVIVPVGGGGYTLDAVGAANLVREIEPKLVIPVHASDDKLNYEVPQQAIELFTKELSAPVEEEVVEKYKFKALPEQLTVQLLKRQ